MNMFEGEDDLHVAVCQIIEIISADAVMSVGG